MPMALRCSGVMPAWLMVTGWPTWLSTPARLSEMRKSRSAFMKRCAVSWSASSMVTTPAVLRNSRSATARDPWLASRGYQVRRMAACSSHQRATWRAFSWWRSMRSASVLMPRSSR